MMLEHTCQRRRNAVRLRLFTALSPVSQGFSHDYIKPPRCLACQASNSSTPMGHLSTEYVDSLDLIPSAPSPTAPSRSLPSTKNKTPPIPPPKGGSNGSIRHSKEKKKKKKKKKKQVRRSTSTPALPRSRPKSSSASSTVVVERPKNPLAQQASESTTSLTHVRPRPRPRPRAPKDSVVEKDEADKKASRRSTWVTSLDLNAFLGGISHEEDVGVPPLPPIPSSDGRRETVHGGGGGGNNRASFFSRASRVNPRDTFLNPDLAKPLPPPPPSSSSANGKDSPKSGGGGDGDLHKLRTAPRASRSSPRLSTLFSSANRSSSNTGGKRSSALFGSGPPEDREAKERLLVTSSPPSSPGGGGAASSPKSSKWFDATLSAKEAYKDGGDKRSTCLWMKMDGNGKVSYNGMGMMGLGTL
ncbi:hypothetical protein IWZ00DRAFT_564174 [Phyllosticta capitalensis]|uniref:uncharacterized protein n=1 Tax=Phyllosticta capitalensis TaxID=121624 RepID=UPI0031305AEB